MLVRTAWGLIGLLFLFFLTSTAAAQPQTEEQVQARLTEPNYARGGYYIGFEGLVAWENSPLIAGDDGLLSGGFDVRLGARHNRWLATEIYGIYVHEFADTNFLAWGMSLNERLYFTRARLQPFVTAGAGFLQLRSRLGSGTGGFSPKFSMLFGGGVEIYATESVVFTIMANYHLPIGEGTDIDFVTGGLGMQFF